MRKKPLREPADPVQPVRAAEAGAAGSPGTDRDSDADRETAAGAEPAADPSGRPAAGTTDATDATDAAGAAPAGAGARARARSGAAAGATPAGPRRRRARVRNRLLASVAVCALAVLAAGAPAVLAAGDDVSHSQDLVALAQLDKQAIALAHALADERDGTVAYVASGRDDRKAAGLTAAQRDRVDRGAGEIRHLAPASLRAALGTLDDVRRRTQHGDGSPRAAYDAYSRIIDPLLRIDAEVARRLPARAEAPASAALPDLGRAVDQASATRALLRGALAGDGRQTGLTSAALQARVREQAALADFHATADKATRDRYDRTVTGADVGLAGEYLDILTDLPSLDAEDRAQTPGRVASSLAARIDAMRGVQASLAVDQLRRLERLRDDDVTTLETRIAFVGACLLVAVAVCVQTARSVARPLSVLTRGSRRLAADPVAERPVEFRGRNDEFADVVRSLNRLRETAVALQERASGTDADQAYLESANEALTAERDRLRAELDALGPRLEEAQAATRGTFVHMGARTLALVERQLGVIEGLEENETDPDQLGTLFALDHLATRMRRYSENLLLLAGAEQTGPPRSSPVALLDVLRAAISEIEHYERAELGTLPSHVLVAAFAADDLSHLVAELLENGTAFSPAEIPVRVSGWLLETGEVMLSVEDEGVGIPSRRLSALNARLSTPEAQQPPASAAGVLAGAGPEGAGVPDGAGEELGMGLYLVTRLALRHGLRVQLQARKQGGVAAVVAVPPALVVTPGGPDAGVPGVVGLPGMRGPAVREVPEHGGPLLSVVPEPAAGPDDSADREPHREAGDGGGHPGPRHAAVPAPPEGPADAGEPGGPAAPPVGEETGAEHAAAFDAAAFDAAAFDAAGLDGPADPGAQVPGRAPAGLDVPAGPDAPASTDAPAPGGAPAGSDAPAGPGPEAAAPATGGPRHAAGPPAPETAPETVPGPGPGAGPGHAAEAAHGTAAAPAPAAPPPAAPAGGLRQASRLNASDDPLVAAAERAIRAAAERAHGRADEPPSVPGQRGGGHPPPAPAGGASEHGRAADQAAPADPGAAPREPAPAAPVVTPLPLAAAAKRLPKRTPRQVPTRSVPPRPAVRGADAEELRRRLDGFQRGARDGRRDAEAEAAAGAAPEGGGPAGQAGAQTDGGTAEEART